MKNERNLTCLVCPRGCQLTVKFDTDGSISSITGNACKRGVTYAENECTHPVRTVTTTVRCENGEVIPVKTSAAVPKEMMMDVMKAINTTVAKNGLKVGEVVIEKVCGTDADVIATAEAR